MKVKFIRLVIDGTRERYGEDVDPKTHIEQIYLCARSYRDMAEMIKQRLPEENRSAAVIAINGVKSWPSSMRWIKPQVGVWVAARRNPITVFQVMSDGTRIEID